MTEPENLNRNNLDAAEGILYALRLTMAAAGLLLPLCLVAGYPIYLVMKP